MKTQKGDYIRTEYLTDEQIERFLQAAELEGARVFSLHADSCMYRFAGEGARNTCIGWTEFAGTRSESGGIVLGFEPTEPRPYMGRDVTAYFSTPIAPTGDPIEAARERIRRFALTVISILILTLVIALGMVTCAHADATFTASHNIVNTYSGSSFEVGYRTAGDWEFQAGYQQPARTVFGDRGSRGIFTVTKRYDLGGVWFGRFGGAITPDYKLIGPVNFRFGGGVRFGRWEIEYMHASSAGIFEPNRGLDSVGVRYVF